ncbi:MULTISPECIES: hypothetical protein [unclassified Paenibacillus]|nr:MULTISPECIES: hypothetical protein [unclassified Paenibacillus]MDQ0896394.1 hypothetical protein [Paenibacillus sp. V4I7]MDQ0914062.1 hypothetical protein [Paenibacillus sp. V4I5]
MKGNVLSFIRKPQKVEMRSIEQLMKERKTKRAEMLRKLNEKMDRLT